MFPQVFGDRQAKYDYRQVFLDFNRSLQTIKDRTSLVSSILTRIYELIPAKEIHLFWENSDTTRYNQINNPESGLYLHAGDGLVKWLEINEKPLIVSHAPEYANIFSVHDMTVVEQLDSQLICPLKTGNQFKGIVFMGNKENNRAYQSHDLEMLSILLDNAALALENIFYHEERITHLKHIMQTDRLAVVGQLAAGAAHEIRNPLTSIKSAIQYVQADIQDVKKRAIINSVLSEVDRINDILVGLLSFSRQNNPVKRSFDLVATINQTLLLIRNTRLKKQVTFELAFFADSATIMADSDQLKQVFMNILLNAIDAVNDEGVIRIDVQPLQIEKERFYAIAITDNGRGIASESMEKIFDPFYTTKENGTGLGLSISYGIIHRHGGKIDIYSRPGEGTRVVVQLPEGIEE